MSRFKVGDIVTGASRSQSMWGNKQTVNSVSDNGYTLTDYSRETIWYDNELKLVTTKEETRKVGRRTFKLLKDLPDAKKGALFQEECEDGTQPYSIIDGGDDCAYRYQDRANVENNPKWFVEVFQVEQQYMTQEELDQFEAFKKSKTSTKRPVGRPKGKK